MGGQRRNEGHGKRLTAAFEALEVFPALAESRNRVLALVSEDRPSTAGVVNAIESDVALVIAVLRLANSLEGPRRGKVPPLNGRERSPHGSTAIFLSTRFSEADTRGFRRRRPFRVLLVSGS